MVWKPAPGEEEYYAIPSPSSQQSLSYLLPGLVVRVPEDRTYGRAALPYSPAELRIRNKYKHWEGKVSVQGEIVAYQVWEPVLASSSSSSSNESAKKNKNSSLVPLHGINDWGGKFAEHAPIFLENGYRIIVPDLPSHGRSTGIHVYLTSLDILADSVYAVMAAVHEKDKAGETSVPDAMSHRFFVSGQSLGGFVAVMTCIKYGSQVSHASEQPEHDQPADKGTHKGPQISGGLFLCPMLAISPHSRPGYLIELMARGLSRVLGALPFAAANKGKNSEDPDVEMQFDCDPQTYHGKLRIATGLAILKALTELETQLSNLTLPFSVHHGTGDRVTSYHGSEKLVKEAKSTDKEIHLYDGYEHILLRKGKDEKDDERRQTVLRDMLDWLDRHASSAPTVED